MTDLSKKLSKNFTLREAVFSQTAIRHGIDNTPPEVLHDELIHVAQEILQPCRDHFGVPITPSSFYRSPELCKKIGSSTKSQHAKGEAVDFEVPGISNYALAQWIAENLVFDQLILEFYNENDPNSGWVHCSSKKEGNRREMLRFDGKRYLPGLA